MIYYFKNNNYDGLLRYFQRDAMARLYLFKICSEAVFGLFSSLIRFWIQNCAFSWVYLHKYIYIYKKFFVVVLFFCFYYRFSSYLYTFFFWVVLFFVFCVFFFCFFLFQILLPLGVIKFMKTGGECERGMNIIHLKINKYYVL